MKEISGPQVTEKKLSKVRFEVLTAANIDLRDARLFNLVEMHHLL
jgi:hypothetical protein